jgi:hypothetical protein
MRLGELCAIATLAGCGRIAFDPLAGDAAGAGAQDAQIDGRSLPTGLVLWLEMETDPPAIVDSAAGHTVQCSQPAQCPSRTAGKHGSGYMLSNAAGLHSLTVTYRADLDPTSGFTIAAWVQLVPVVDYLCAFTEPWPTGSNPDWDTFAMCVDGTSAQSCGTNACYWNTDPAATTCGLVLDSSWHHLAMTWDGATKTGFVDGVAVGSTPVASLGFDASDLRVGGDLDGGLQPNFFWSGVLDDVMWFSRPLAPAEIAAIASP